MISAYALIGSLPTLPLIEVGIRKEEMGRPLRIEYAGGRYHVINRGNYRRNLFGEEGGAEAFERVLGEAAERYGWRVHAYVVMRNHFHLAIELTEPNLSVGMKWLQGTWVRRNNRFRKLVGRPFQDRFKALVVEHGAAFSGVCDYIHLNPVRAHAVKAEAMLEYPWSSLPKWTRKDRPKWLDPRTALGERGGLPDSAQGWKKYYAALALAAEEVTQVKRRTAGSMSRGWCLGSAGFRAAMKDRMKRKGQELEWGRKAGLELEDTRRELEEAWEDRLQRLAKVAKISLDRLPEKKSDPGKALLAAAMKRSSAVSNAWLAQRLKMGKPASASQFARRFLIDNAGSERVDRLLSKIKT